MIVFYKNAFLYLSTIIFLSIFQNTVFSQENELNIELNEYIDISGYNTKNYPFFISGCFNKEIKCESCEKNYNEKTNYIIITLLNNKGEIIEISDSNIYQIGWVGYMIDEKDFFIEAQGGMWSLLRTNDIFKHLIKSDFNVVSSNLDAEILLKIASKRECDISYVSLNLYRRFYEHVDPWTGVTISVAHVPEKRLDRTMLRALAAWRNAHDMPWSTAVHDPEFDEEQQHFHSIRMGIAGLLMTIPIWQEFGAAIMDAAELEGLSKLDWAKRHISEFAGLNDRFLLWDSFAWFTAPSYEEGNLPTRVEQILARIATGKHLQDKSAEERDAGFWVQETPLSERLPTIMQSLDAARQRLQPSNVKSGVYTAGFDVRYFLDRRKLEQQRAGPWTETR